MNTLSFKIITILFLFASNFALAMDQTAKKRLQNRLVARQNAAMQSGSTQKPDEQLNPASQYLNEGSEIALAQAKVLAKSFAEKGNNRAIIIMIDANTKEAGLIRDKLGKEPSNNDLKSKYKKCVLEAREWMGKGGNVQAIYNLGLECYLVSELRVDDKFKIQMDKIAFPLLYKAMELGVSEAGDLVSFMYAKGRGPVNKNVAEANKILQELKLQGHNRLPAMTSDSNVVVTGINDDSEKIEAYHAKQRASDENMLCGKINFFGCDGEFDFGQSAQYFFAAKMQEHVDAPFYYGLQELLGLGIQKNTKNALMVFQEPSGDKVGLNKAMAGLCYLRGIGTKRRPELANKYLHESQTGIANVLLHLAPADAKVSDDELFSRGEAWEKAECFEKAFAAFYSVAMSGNVKALFKVGVYYFEGKGIKQFPAWGTFYLGAAAHLGHESAIQELQHRLLAIEAQKKTAMAEMPSEPRKHKWQKQDRQEKRQERSTFNPDNAPIFSDPTCARASLATTGFPVIKSPEEIFEENLCSANKGDNAARLEIAKAFAYGIGTEKDLGFAEIFLKRIVSDTNVDEDTASKVKTLFFELRPNYTVNDFEQWKSKPFRNIETSKFRSANKIGALSIYQTDFAIAEDAILDNQVEIKISDEDSIKYYFTDKCQSDIQSILAVDNDIKDCTQAVKLKGFDDLPVYKARFKIANHLNGRVIYYQPNLKKIYFLHAYSKGTKENISNKDENRLREMINEIRSKGAQS